MTLSNTIAVAGARALAMMAALAAPAGAEDGATGSAVDGAELFALHCATCHGADAMGNGPLAPVLTIQPKNLTALAAENGGAFPLGRVVARIDGRDPLVAHGSPMPVFGPFFDGDRGVALKVESGQPVMVSQPVADLIAYLLTLQK